MAAHNAEETIREALDSLLGQTLDDWEAFVVDDASSDRTLDIANSYCIDSRITVISLSNNSGAGIARNTVLPLCSAALIAVLDADDRCTPDRLSLQVARFEADPFLDVLGSQVAEFGSWGGPIAGSWPTTTAGISDRIRRSKMPIAHCSMMIRKDLIVSVGGYDEDCLKAEDFALLRKLRHAKFAADETSLLHYRTRRPIPLSYVIASGRYGKLARVRTRKFNPRPHAKVQMPPFSLITDARSIFTWLRRRQTEKIPTH